MKPTLAAVMVRLLYVSRATGPQTTTVTTSILLQAQAHNPGQGITGVLCQGQGLFFQVLEGERSRVNALYRRICADTRHHEVELLHYEDITERRFGQWAMALINWSTLDPVLDQPSADLDPYAASGAQVLAHITARIATGQAIALPSA